MKKTVGIITLVFGLLIYANESYAVDVEAFIKAGTIDSDEENHSMATGHKVMLGVGIRVSTGKRLLQQLTAEYWTMAEPVDDDREFPHDGLSFIYEISYLFSDNNLDFYPYIGIGLERWRRNSPDEGDQDRYYGDLYFSEFTAGIGTKYKSYYFKGGVLLPFWSDTDSGQRPDGKLGFTLNAGYLWKKFDLGVFFRESNFGSDGSQPDFQLRQYGLIIAYRFA